MVIIFVLIGILRLLLLIEDGIIICSNDKHLLKEYSPIFVTDDGISICFNDEQ